MISSTCTEYFYCDIHSQTDSRTGVQEKYTDFLITEQN